MCNTYSAGFTIRSIKRVKEIISFKFKIVFNCSFFSNTIKARIMKLWVWCIKIIILLFSDNQMSKPI